MEKGLIWSWIFLIFFCFIASMGEKHNSIAVVGCGWLGLPFSKRMIAQGWTVNGSTTNPEKIHDLKAMGIEPYLLKFPTNEKIDESFFHVHNLLINLPPGRRNPDLLHDYPDAIRQILEEALKINTIRKIVFISSTSVYGNSVDLIDETTEPIPESDSGKAILQSEKQVYASGIPNVILRFGGLAGPERHPGRFLAGRERLTIGEQSANFLHLDDAIGVIEYMLNHQEVSECFNVAAPFHPTKKDFYIKMAKSIGLEPPTFIKTPEESRREISVDKLLKKTNYTFIHPDPMSFTF